MPIFQRLLRVLYRQIAEVSWLVVATVGAAHAILSWLLLLAVGEAHMLPPATFAYWYLVTASTVGYGDIAPQGDAGRLVTAFFVFPGAIALFTTVIAKAITGLSNTWRRRMNGLADYSSLTGHTILVGYHPSRTLKMIDELLAGRPDSEIVLLCRGIEQNPDSRIRFVRADGASIVEDMHRAGLAGAATVLVYADDDDQTLAASLAASAADRDVAVVAFFRSATQAGLLRAHCPRARVILSDAVEQVVREAQDPGAGQVLSLLASAVEEAAVFTGVLPRAATVAQVDTALRASGAVLVGVQNGSAPPQLLPPPDTRLEAGDRFHYVSRRRLESVEV